MKLPMIAFLIPDGGVSPNPVEMAGFFVKKSMLSDPAPRFATDPTTMASTPTASSAEATAAISASRLMIRRRRMCSTRKRSGCGTALTRCGAEPRRGGR
jgi:hypothetical protein